MFISTLQESRNFATGRTKKPCNGMTITISAIVEKSNYSASGTGANVNKKIRITVHPRR